MKSALRIAGVFLCLLVGRTEAQSVSRQHYSGPLCPTGEAFRSFEVQPGMDKLEFEVDLSIEIIFRRHCPTVARFHSPSQQEWSCIAQDGIPCILTIPNPEPGVWALSIAFQMTNCCDPIILFDYELDVAQFPPLPTPTQTPRPTQTPTATPTPEMFHEVTASPGLSLVGLFPLIVFLFLSRPATQRA